mmetsp:Transcript_51931/g.157732  ORF Transcript_51931/g.157732 Transcript_51931/m.157732 type:complete len:297 (+) Transcript_51931:2-892(+)
MAMRSERRSASSMKCVESKIVRPTLRAAIKRQMSRRDVASTPAVGSSSATMLDPPASAMQIDSFRFMPPLKARVGADFLAASPTSRSKLSISAWICERGMDLRQQNKRMCSSTVTFSYKALCWRHTPSWRLTPKASWRIEVPLTRTSPSLGAYSPVSIDIVVDLPAPLCPNNATTVPRCMSRVMPCSARLPFPNVFAKRRIDTERAWPAGAGSQHSNCELSACSCDSLCPSPASSEAPCGSQYEGRIGKYQGWGNPRVPGQTFSTYHASAKYTKVSTQSIRNTCPRLWVSFGTAPL